MLHFASEAGGARIVDVLEDRAVSATATPRAGGCQLIYQSIGALQIASSRRLGYDMSNRIPLSAGPRGHCPEAPQYEAFDAGGRLLHAVKTPKSVNFVTILVVRTAAFTAAKRLSGGCPHPRGGALAAAGRGAGLPSGAVSGAGAWVATDRFGGKGEARSDCSSVVGPRPDWNPGARTRGQWG